MSLFDPTLKVFDVLRRDNKSHIDWVESTLCMRVNCRADEAEQKVSNVIRGIKLKLREVEAEIESACRVYFIVPPTSDAMRTIVRPTEGTMRREASGKITVTRFELAGDQLSAPKLLEWKNGWKERNSDVYEAFRTELIEKTLKLADLRKWMRMRVHFGHTILGMSKDDFRAGIFGFEEFEKMMKNSRVSTNGKFDPK
jgi:hypothetical protein